MKGKIGIVLVSLFLLSAMPVVLGDHASEGEKGVVLGTEASMGGSGFTENRGQWDREIGMLTSTPFGHMSLNDGSVIYNMIDPGSSEKGCVIETVMEGSNEVSPEGLLPRKGVSNYFIGDQPDRWATGVQTFSKAVYSDAWNGIDMIYYNSEDTLKYDILLEPYSDHEDIVFRVAGHTNLRVDGDSIVISTPLGIDIRDGGLKAWYDDSGEQMDVSFQLIDGDRYTFDIEGRDPSRPVRIDPIIFSTLLGSYDRNHVYDIVRDEAGNNYMVGDTDSPDFPLTPGAYRTEIEGFSWYDGFIFKMDPTGTDLLYSTYFGGEDMERLTDVELDGSGNMVILGYTKSSDIPTTTGVYNETKNGDGSDLIVFKMSPSGDSLLYSTYLGGSSNEELGYAGTMEIMSDGRIAVAAGTQSSDYPTTADAYDNILGPMTMAKGVVTIMSSDLSSLSYSTMIGGMMSTLVRGLDIGPSGCIYITGNSNCQSFPVTQGSFRTDPQGFREGFVAKLNLTSYDLIEYATYLGEGDPLDIEVDSEGRAHITGYSRSLNFPTNDEAYDPVYNGDNDIFVMKLKADGTDIDYSTFIGSADDESAFDLEISHDGKAMICGETKSVDFPYSINYTNDKGEPSYDTRDSLISVLSRDGSKLSYSVLFGSGDHDSAKSIFLEDNGDVVVAGQTRSAWFPTTDGAYHRNLNANEDIYLLRMNLTLPPGQIRNLETVQGDGWVRLQWEKPLFDGGLDIDSYRIYKGDLPSLIGEYNSTGGNRSFVDTEVVLGETYYYKVSPVNGAGEGPISTMTEVVAVSRPEAPVNLRIETDDTEAKLTWNRPYITGELPILGYSVYRDDGSGETHLVAEVGTYDMEYRDDGLSNGVTYDYWMTATNRIGESDPTDRYQATPLGLPDSPGHFTAYLENGSVVLAWSEPADTGGAYIEGYEILKHLEEGGSAVMEVSDDLTFVDTEVSVGREYTYSLRTRTTMGRSEETREVSIFVKDIPTPPLGLTAVGEDGICSISWNHPASEGGTQITGYEIHRSVDDGDMKFLDDVISTNMFYMDTDVENGLTYSYRIRAINEMGHSDLSEEVRVKPSGPPSPPEGFSAIQQNTTMALQWNSPSDNGGTDILSYRITRTVNGISSVIKTDNTTRQMLDTEAPRGKEIIYSIRSVNARGSSEEVSLQPVMITTEPEAPVSVNIEQIRDSIRITWEAPVWNGGTIVTGYSVMRSVNGSAQWEEIDTVGSETREITDIDLVFGAVHSYRIAAINEKGYSDPTEEVSIVPTTVPGAPNAPVTLDNGWVEIGWSAPEENGGEEILYYLVERSVDGETYVEIGTVLSSETTFMDHDVEEGKEYTYRIIAVNGNGGSQPSEATTHMIPEAEDKSLLSSVSPILYVSLIGLLVLVVVILLITVMRKKRTPSPEPVPSQVETGNYKEQGYDQGYDQAPVQEGTYPYQGNEQNGYYQE